MTGPTSQEIGEAVAELRRKAAHCSVSFSLAWHEHNDSWSVDVSSPAPGECFTGKDRSFEVAILSANEHLDRISPKG